MRPILYALSFLAVIGLAFWAYRENYATQKSLRQVEALQTEIGTLREALAVQRAEWAYLNRPDRLRELSTINFDRLGLFPLEPTQFGQIDQVGYPVPPAMFPQDSLDGILTIDLSGTLADPDAPTDDSACPPARAGKTPTASSARISACARKRRATVPARGPKAACCCWGSPLPWPSPSLVAGWACWLQPSRPSRAAPIRGRRS
jgi:hypothetical protein